MSTNKKPAVEVVAMHGWAGDARHWSPWILCTEKEEWRWICGDRGYGSREMTDPVWEQNRRKGLRRVFIAYSLGLHLVAPHVLEGADDVVLLACFGRFLPEGIEGRRLRKVLDGMARSLDCEAEAKAMLAKFFANAASPQSPALLPTGLREGDLNLVRLKSDLLYLRDRQGLPPGFPRNARVLIVEAESDLIVRREVRSALRTELPAADILSLRDVGHGLICSDLMESVVAWVGRGA